MLLLSCLVIGLAAFVHAELNMRSSNGFCNENSIISNILESDLSDCETLLINERYKLHPKDVLLNTEFFNKLPATIETVHLKDNNITEISFVDFKNFPKFEYLHLGNNKIKQLKNGTLVNFASLRRFRLAFNEIETIEPGFFEDLSNLVFIDLSNNRITHLEKGVFKGLVKIRYIKMESNQLTAIAANIFSPLPMELNLFTYSNNRLEDRTAIFGKTCRLPMCEIDFCVSDICHIVQVYREGLPDTIWDNE